MTRLESREELHIPRKLPTVVSELESLIDNVGASSSQSLTALEVRLSALRDDLHDGSTVTQESMKALVEAGEIDSYRPVETLQALMTGLTFPGSEEQLFDGTFTVALKEAGDGNKIQYAELPGSTHEMADEDGNKFFPGGLSPFALQKLASAAALDDLGSPRADMHDTGDAEYLKSVYGKQAHMGLNMIKTTDGRKVYVGMSGAEMTHGAIDIVNSTLPEDQQDGEFTIAGRVDGLVAKWAAQLYADEVVSLETAQLEFDEMWKDVLQNGVEPHHH